MSWNKFIRQSHRWVSIVFALTVIANILRYAIGQGNQPPEWVTYSPLLPLLFLLITGLYLFALPYVAKWRGWRGTSQ